MTQTKHKKICNDENNLLQQCPKINMTPCVQPKGMGGHQAHLQIYI